MSEVRICENCNHPNDINNLECEKCGFDLSFIIPVDFDEVVKQESNQAGPFNVDSATSQDQQSELILVSTDGALSIPIYNELIIGRDGINGDYFEKSKFVSRKHAIFYVENNEVLVFDASTNGTFVNDERLPKMTKVPIHSYDRISFADVSFEVQNADR